MAAIISTAIRAADNPVNAGVDANDCCILVPAAISGPPITTRTNTPAIDRGVT